MIPLSSGSKDVMLYLEEIIPGGKGDVAVDVVGYVTREKTLAGQEGKSKTSSVTLAGIGGVPKTSEVLVMVLMSSLCDFQTVDSRTGLGLRIPVGVQATGAGD